MQDRQAIDLKTASGLLLATEMDQEIERPAKWFEDVSNQRDVPSSLVWDVDKEKLYSNYGNRYKLIIDAEGEELHKPMGYFLEKGETLHSEIIILPNGKVITPIRQFCDIKILKKGEREASFYEIIGTNQAQIREENRVKADKVDTNPRGTRIVVGYDNLIDDTIALVDATNKSFALESIYDETSVVLNSFENPLSKFWLDERGNEIESDDRCTNPLTIKGLFLARQRLALEGVDTSNLTLYTTGKAIADMASDPVIESYLRGERPEIITRHIIEKITGVKLIPTALKPIVKTRFKKESVLQKIKRVVLFRKKPTEQYKVYRSVLFIPHITFGLVVGEKLVMEAQRRNEIQAVHVTGTQRSAAVVKNENFAVRISHG